ncbi:MAG: aminoglycoside phosphotransferase family protein [Nocardioidaceae bacterium]
MTRDQIDDAVAEAVRRRRISDRDLSASVRHFVEVLPSICREWDLTVERWLPGGAGTPPLAVRRTDGSTAVLKIAEPGAQDVAVSVLRAGDGHGYAKVLAWEADCGALLLERLGHDLWTEESTLSGQGRVLVPLLGEAWQVPMARGRPFQGKASGLLAILADLGPRYGSHHEDVLSVATEYAGELAASETAEVVCHGDPHPGNVLRSGEGWALIDPDGFIGERAYDLGVVMRDACREIRDAEASRPGAARSMLREESRRLAEAANVDPERVWRWGFVERVTTGLYLRWFGHARESATFLDTAALLVN